MPIKFRLTAEEYEALSDEAKAAYKKDGDAFVVDLQGAPASVSQADVDAAVQAKNHEKQRRQEAERRIKELEQSSNTGEAETLKQQLNQLNERLTSRDNALKETARKSAAQSVTKLAKSPRALEPHVMNRLVAELDDSGNAVVKILGADGKVSDLTLEQLGQEFQKDADFADLMLGPQSGGGGGGQPANAGGTTKALKDMDEAERVAMAKADPEGFRKLVETESASA